MSSPTVSIEIKSTADALEITASSAPGGVELPEKTTLFVAVDAKPERGLGVVPYAKGAEGSTVFLPIVAERLFAAGKSGGWVREWRDWKWQDSTPSTAAAGKKGALTLRVPLAKNAGPVRVAVYAKDLAANDGWGATLADARGFVPAGGGDQFVRGFFQIEAGRVEARRSRQSERVRIYQAMPRLFGNINETRKENGTLAENGVGKFRDFNDAALRSLREMGFTHLWLTGALQQATATDYAAQGSPADDADLLKGLAGSPYAIKDYFRVCYDYVDDPKKWREEFAALCQRCRAAGLAVLLDFVPNHVARSYASNERPELTFGAQDDQARFFDPKNNFFYLPGQPLRLPTVRDGQVLSPTCRVLGQGDGMFPPEAKTARVTGNNAATPTPGQHDWYETAKLNYGFDFTNGTRAFPHAAEPSRAVPDTWLKMDAILAHWQSLGVGGFRCDMAHMIPPEFWQWAIGRARARQGDVFFCAEGYDTDPMKVEAGDPLLRALHDHRGHVMTNLLAAGFDAVYDDPSYKVLKGIYDSGKWANDLDHALPGAHLAAHSLRYAENHDEVRLAGRNEWGNIGPAVGRPVSAILYALGRGPVLLYSGQEVGEPAAGTEGFGGDDARTTIFDYWAMPELQKWVNGHRYDGGRLAAEQRELRAFYARLLNLVGQPAFRDGECAMLNHANAQNPAFGRLPGETASGHWLYAFTRRDAASGQAFLCVVNLHRSETLRGVTVDVPDWARSFIKPGPATERLSAPGRTLNVENPAHIPIGDLPPLTPLFFELGGK